MEKKKKIWHNDDEKNDNILREETVKKIDNLVLN